MLLIISLGVLLFFYVCLFGKWRVTCYEGVYNMTFIPEWVFNREELRESYSTEEMREVHIRAEMFEKEWRKRLEESQIRYFKLEASYEVKVSMLANSYRAGNVERCTNLINDMLKDFCVKYDSDVIQIKGVV